MSSPVDRQTVSREEIDDGTPDDRHIPTQPGSRQGGSGGEGVEGHESHACERFDGHERHRIRRTEKAAEDWPGTFLREPQGEGLVFRQGDPADAVFYVEDGRIQISVVSDHGKEGVVAILGPDDFFGEGCLAGQAHHMATARTMAASIVVRIEKATMVRMLHEQADIAEMFMAFVLSRNIQIEADLIDQLFNSSERRLARLLLHLGNIGKVPTIETVLPKINQDMLAARIGTTRSRINYFMNKFRKLGFIEYGGKGALKVHSSLLSVVVHD